MSEIAFSQRDKDAIVQKIQRYFDSELNQEIGQFDAEFLLDFFAKEIGGNFYNQGLTDARIILEEKVADITDAFYEIEKPAV